MKITLDASIKEHREIGLVLKAIVCPDNEYFVEWIDGLEYRACHKITIDLSKAEMDLRLAIGTDIEFEGYDYFKGLLKGKITSIDTSDCNYFLSINDDIEYEKECVQLSKSYLKSIGVEIEEGEE